MEDQAWRSNRLLSALPASARSLVLQRAVQQNLKLKSVLYVEYETPSFAYFPLAGVASVVALTGAGETAEVGLVGCEGLTAGYHLLGPAKVPTRCFVQVAGTFLRVPFSDLNAAYHSSPEFCSRVNEFLQGDGLSVSQMAACNQIHNLKSRLARWLLMADDRHPFPTLGLTHDILAEMTGAQRTTVTAIASDLKRTGLIRYSHGEVEITDRAHLEKIACSCYEIARELYQGLYQPNPGSIQRRPASQRE